MHRLRLPCLLAACSALATAQAPESIWYVRNNEDGIASFIAHARRVSVVAPQVYSIDSAGTIRGGTDPRIVAVARASGVKLMPLVMNHGFGRGILHNILTDSTAWSSATRTLADLCRRERVDGIQLDLENLHVSDRDAFTAFVWMYDHWRGAYDYKALADTLDFISYMTYAQHTGGSTPRPVAGVPWMEASLDYVLAQRVPPEKISLGIPAYSDYWFPGYNAVRDDARPTGQDIAYSRLMDILREAGAVPTWDDRQKAWFAMSERHGVFEHAWAEVARASEANLGLVHAHHLRGYSVWLMGLEDLRTWDVVGPVRR